MYSVRIIHTKIKYYKNKLLKLYISVFFIIDKDALSIIYSGVIERLPSFNILALNSVVKLNLKAIIKSLPKNDYDWSMVKTTLPRNYIYIPSTVSVNNDQCSRKL